MKGWAKDLNRHFSKDYTEISKAHKKMLSIISDQGYTNRNHNEMQTVHTIQEVEVTQMNAHWQKSG